MAYEFWLLHSRASMEEMVHQTGVNLHLPNWFSTCICQQLQQKLRSFILSFSDLWRRLWKKYTVL